MDQHPREQSDQPAEAPVYTFPLELRWSDQDLYGHVNNARIVTLAEEARVRFALETAGREDDGRREARVVARQTVDYHAPVHYGPELTMHVGVVRVGTSSYTLRQQGHQDGRAVFTVDTVMVVLGEDHRARPLTDAERAHLQEWTWPEGGTDAEAARS
ncbi:acyl-CoA thioesterase [Micrococcus terreus]|uniref:Acyl-CoA thioester hydrolase n=1 Tax=Micrococcus terreus TaxID=574650 RepID=A0A1I7MNB0_9MICC|nr:acyl-CoA thioesterase [Micrococcus terreus]SFV23405.1 acyl-CoA thioester hydrolase [Micrococcus terreus]